jgi:hypothetical protein
MDSKVPDVGSILVRFRALDGVVGSGADARAARECARGVLDRGPCHLPALAGALPCGRADHGRADHGRADHGRGDQRGREGAVVAVLTRPDAR